MKSKMLEVHVSAVKNDRGVLTTKLDQEKQRARMMRNCSRYIDLIHQHLEGTLVWTSGPHKGEERRLDLVDVRCAELVFRRTIPELASVSAEPEEREEKQQDALDRLRGLLARRPDLLPSLGLERAPKRVIEGEIVEPEDYLD